MCQECYVNDHRATPLLHPLDCLAHHMQYICGTCGRCICIERDPKRGLQRWNFPFTSLNIAKLYLRTADYTNKKACGIYEMQNSKGRVFYKIFVDHEAVKAYLVKNKDKVCKTMQPVYIKETYQEFDKTQVRKLTNKEIEQYLLDIKNSKYFMVIKSYFQPKKPIKSAFMLCAVQSRKG